jgi:hypothetical protein
MIDRVTNDQTETRPDHATGLKQAGQAYKRARDKADALLAKPREDLTEAVRAAYAAGMRKADILRAIDHAWSRQWVDDNTRDITPPGRRPKRPRTSDTSE